MPNNHLTIFLSPNKLNKEWFLQHNEPVQWVYLGKKFHEKVRIEAELGEGYHCLDIARIHNIVANDVRQDFVRWIDALNKLNGSTIGWWFGPISSRNVYRSDIFQYCCYIEILERLWRDSSQRPKFVIVESPALAEIILKWGSERKIVVKLQGKTNIPWLIIRDYTIFFLRWLDFILCTIMRRCASVKRRINPNKNLVIISTYIHPTSLSDTGKFSDRYFPFLYEFLEKTGKNIAVLPMFYGFRYNYYPVFSKIKKSGTSFIIPEQYLTITDYCHAFLYPFRLILEKIVSIPFHAIDYSEVLREDIIKDKFGDSLEAILCYHLIVRLKDAGIRTERIIDWFENQAKSRALCAGFRKNFHGIPVIGAQIFLHYPNFLSLAPSESEFEASMVPDVLLETSAYQCKLATIFAPRLNCIPAAALRYSHIFKTKSDSVRDPCQHCERIILLLASFDIEETRELLSQVQKIMDKLDGDIRILIKFHPDVSKRDIVDIYDADAWPERLEIYEGDLSKAMYMASLVISKSSTSSIVEAAALGIPVIFLGNQTKLNFNPLDGIDLPFISECYTADELEISISRYLALSSDEREYFKKSGEYLRDLFFTEVNDDTLSPFLY
jgi:hypothetical protein